MSTKLNIANQKLAPGDLVELFILDLSPIGVVGTRRFTNSVQPDEANAGLMFDGQFYDAVDFKSEGWEYNGQGAFPRPKIQISNVGGFLSQMLYDYQDLVGCQIARLRTFSQFLDGMPEADPDVYYPPDIYRIHQKVKQNKKMIVFELAAPVDQEGQKLPARKILRDTCTQRYRRWVPGEGFDYTHVTCPYNGTSYFNAKGESTLSASEDKCGLQLRDCKLRFGNQNLPTWAFPGVLRQRV